MNHDLPNPIETFKIYQIVRDYMSKNRCVVHWHHNIPIQTPIDLVIDTEFVDPGCRYVRPVPHQPALLIINHEDRFHVPYESYIGFFMPLGPNDEVKAENPHKLADLFDFSDEQALLRMLSIIGAYEVSDFDLHEGLEDVVTQVRDGKIIQSGIDQHIPESELHVQGWVRIDDQHFCYCPMAHYIIWGDIYSDDEVRVIIY